MAYADRGTIGDRIDERRREGRTFDARETVGIATEVAYALVDVHASGHLHRDVKPTNVLIRSSSTRRDIAGLAPDETIVLGDFGLARGLDLSALTMVAGSPGYVAPEQAAGLTQLDRRADLYPLGRMMLEMLTGDPGGRATTMAGAAAEQVDVAGPAGGVTGRTATAQRGARRPDHPARRQQPRRPSELGRRGCRGARRHRRGVRRARRRPAADGPAGRPACGGWRTSRRSSGTGGRRPRRAAIGGLVASPGSSRRRRAAGAGGVGGHRRGHHAGRRRWLGRHDIDRGDDDRDVVEFGIDPGHVDQRRTGGCARVVDRGVGGVGGRRPLPRRTVSRASRRGSCSPRARSRPSS